MTNCREVYDVLIALSNMTNVSASSSTMAEMTSMGLF